MLAAMLAPQRCTHYCRSRFETPAHSYTVLICWHRGNITALTRR
jgi:hypothetical protein